MSNNLLLCKRFLLRVGAPVASFTDPRPDYLARPSFRKTHPATLIIKMVSEGLFLGLAVLALWSLDKSDWCIQILIDIR